MGTVEIRPAPHVRGARTVEKIMLNVVWSLLPICAFYVFQYGISALTSIAMVTGACLLTERWLAKTGTQAGGIGDYSATITGLLLALTLPPGFPLWMGAIAGFVAACAARGVELKWFGAPRPAGFTSRYDHWRYADPAPLPATDRILAGLLDMRLPLTFSLEDCAAIVRILRDELARAADAPAVTGAAVSP